MRDVVPLPCGKWGCAVCGPKRYRWFVKNVEAAVEEWGLKYFWTLTIAHGSHSPAESWLLISRAWNRFTAVMRKRHGPLVFIWVVEPQKSGHAHLHVLTDKYLDHAEVKEVWERASEGAKVVWVERVKSANVAVYLGKYMGKTSGRVLEIPGLGELWNKHRFGKSRGITFTPFKVKTGGWEYLPYAFKDVWRQAHREGRVVAFNDGWMPSFRMRLGPPGGYGWEPLPGVSTWRIDGQGTPTASTGPPLQELSGAGDESVEGCGSGALESSATGFCRRQAFHAPKGAEGAINGGVSEAGLVGRPSEGPLAGRLQGEGS